MKVITVRKRSCGKVMFLHLSVILFRGEVWQTPPWADTPRSDPPRQTPPQADNPGQTPSLGRHPHADTPRADIPPSYWNAFLFKRMSSYCEPLLVAGWEQMSFRNVPIFSLRVRRVSMKRHFWITFVIQYRSFYPKSLSPFLKGGGWGRVLFATDIPFCVILTF